MLLVRNFKYRIRNWFKYNFPLMLRKSHNQIVANAVNNARQQTSKELMDKERILDELLPKMFKINVSRRENDYGTYMLQIPFRTDFIYQCFAHGNSQSHIEYLARHMAYQFEKELRTINFARFR